jgi:DNA primase
LHHGSRTLRKRNFAILVEGYFDAIVLHRHGFENAVAPLETSLTEEQARLLRRYTEKMIICMDADEAGQRAAVRAAGLLLEQGFTVNIVPLPEGEDPDSFIQKHGEEEFRKLLTGSQPAYGYVLKGAVERFDLSRPYGKREALSEMLPLLDRIKDRIERSHAVTETSRQLGVEEHLVATELQALNRGRKTVASTSSGGKPQALNWLTVAERKLILAAMADPKDSRQVVEELQVMDELSSFTRRVLERLFQLAENGEHPTFKEVAGIAENDEEKRGIAAMAVEFEDGVIESARECALSFAVGSLRRKVSELGARIARLEENDSENLDLLYREMMDLKNKMFKLEKTSVLRTRVREH